jgi:thymidylate kinase
METKKGNLIVIYGANNLGKTAQMNKLEELWQELERPYVRLKYPIYDLEPTGPLINSVLREGVVMSDEELQGVYAQNRMDFQAQVEWYLKNHVDVLAEDYVGTGLAWGLTRGVPRETLDNLNRGLLRPNIEILLDGERLSSGIEKQHRFEQGDDWEKNRQIHRELACEFGWKVVDASGTIEQVHNRVVRTIFAE